MKIAVQVDVQEFSVPNFVLLRPGKGATGPTGESIPLSEVGAEVLGQLCDQFRKDVFKKAGVEDV